jgi:hypothetical protein
LEPASCAHEDDDDLPKEVEIGWKLRRQRPEMREEREGLEMRFLANPTRKL